jgi:hypothetical protein
MSFGSSAECEPLKPFIEPLQTDLGLRASIGRKGRSVVSVCISGPVGRRPMLERVFAAERTKRKSVDRC